MLNYNYRIRNSIDELLFGRGEIDKNINETGPFSEPPTNKKEPYYIIERPKVLGLDEILNKYIDNKPIQEPIKKKSLFKKMF